MQCFSDYKKQGIHTLPFVKFPAGVFRQIGAGGIFLGIVEGVCINACFDYTAI